MVAAAGGCGPAHPPAGAPRSVLLIVIDTMRGDRLGCAGDPRALTPTLDRLAARGVLFADATTPAPITLPAVTSLLTGLYPPHHGVRDNGVFTLDPSRETLAERFRAAGYRTGAVVGSAVLAPDRGLRRGFETYDADFETPYPLYNPVLEPYREEFTGTRRRADRVTEDAAELLRGFGDAPFFLLAHYFDVHMHYDPPPGFAHRHPGRPYDGEISFVDREIGRLLERLPAPESTLVVVVGDHGEAQGDHGEPQHGFLLYQPTLHVPFLVCGPGAASGAIRRDPVSLVDLEPTLATRCGLPGGAAPRDGVPLDWSGDTPAAPPADRTLYSETMHTLVSYGWRELRAVRRGPWKLIGDPPERYDLRADPGEQRELAPGEDGARGARAFDGLERRLARWTEDDASPDAIVERARHAGDAQPRELLAALGYLSAADDTRPARRPHPREALPRWIASQQAKEDLRRAAQLLLQEDTRAADSLAAAVLERAPHHADAASFRGHVAARRGDDAGAARWYERALAIEEGNLEAHRGLARLAERQGNADDALRHWRFVADRDPGDMAALRSTALGLLSGPDPGAAAPYLRRIVEERPEDPTAHYNLGLATERDAPEEARRQFEEFLRLRPHALEAPEVRRWLETGSWDGE
jgi:arylsulfatase A-like enzyme